MTFIDIHTHRDTRHPDILSVLNLFPEDVHKITETGLYSLGIHPWYVQNADIRIVAENAQKKQILAIGEIGLDKLKPDWDLQIELFKAQLRLAKEQNLPVILHCVKAFEEVLSILKSENFTNQVIFHRFGGHINLARQLIEKGYFLSFGQILFNSKSKTRNAFQKIPLSSVFLETDDSEISIQEIYAQASALKSISIDNLKAEIHINLGRFIKI